MNTKQHPAITTLDEFEMPPPPNTGPVEWAITKIETTLRKRKEPGWSEDDAICLQTAVLLCANREEAIPRGLQKRLGLDVGKFGDCIIRHSNKAPWGRFGRFARTIVPMLDGVCAVAEACDVIDAIVEREDVTPPFSPEELQKLAEGEDCSKQFRPVIPKNLERRFRKKWGALSAAANDNYDHPIWIELAWALQIAIPRLEWVREVEAAIATMTGLTDSQTESGSPSHCDLTIENLDRVLEHFGLIHRIGRYFLPHSVAMRFTGAVCAFAEAAVERRDAPWPDLKRALRIERAAGGFGYACCGTEVLPPLEDLP